MQLFFNQSEVAEASGVAASTLSHHVEIQAVPVPTMRIGRRLFFSAEEKAQIVAYFKKRYQEK